MLAVNSSLAGSQRKRDDFLQVNYLDIETKLSGSGALSKDFRDSTAHLLSLSSSFSPVPFPKAITIKWNSSLGQPWPKKDGSVCAELRFWFNRGLQGWDGGKPQLSKHEVGGVAFPLAWISRMESKLKEFYRVTLWQIVGCCISSKHGFHPLAPVSPGSTWADS